MWKMMSVGMGTAALALAALTPVAAHAQRWDDRDRYERGYDDDGYRDHDRAYRGAYRDGWNRGPRYVEDDRRGYYRDARRYRYRDRCQNGTTGTLVGAIAGGLLGRVIDSRGDRTLGTVLGAGAGALAGNAVERADNPRYCRR